MMAMTSGVERVAGMVSDGVVWEGLLLLSLLLVGSLVSGLEVKVMAVVKVVEGRVIVWVRVRTPDRVEGNEGRAPREDDSIALLEEIAEEEEA